MSSRDKMVTGRAVAPAFKRILEHRNIHIHTKLQIVTSTIHGRKAKGALKD